MSAPARRINNVTANFRIDAGVALESATNVLKKFALPSSEQLAYAMAEAAVAIGHSLLKIAELKEQEADARQD